MAPRIEDYPGLRAFIPDDGRYENFVGTETVEGKDYLIVTQIAKGDDQGSGQLLFLNDHGTIELLNRDTVVHIPPLHELDHILPAVPLPLIECRARSSSAHAAVLNVAIGQVDKFKSDAGPDHGNLACCWAVRNIAFLALNEWITRTDGTKEFGIELNKCFANHADEFEIPPGGIIISPTGSGTGTASHGHVGILGAGTGESRLIYSNDSAHAVWKQNFTLGRWRSHYADTLKLDVLFYSLPTREPLTA